MIEAVEKPAPPKRRSPAKDTKPSAWRLYARLLGCAWKYKARLLVSFAFAFVIAASMGAMLVTMGTVMKLTLYDAEAVLAATPPGEVPDADPRDRIAGEIRSYTGEMERLIGWAPQGIDARFENMVDAMRADAMDAILTVCVIVVLLGLVIGIARYIQEYFAGSIGANISTDLAESMYANLLRQSVGFFERSPSGEILSRFTNDIFQVNRGLTGVLVKLMREPLKAAMWLAIALATDPTLTLIGACGLPLVAYLLIRIGKKVRKSVHRSLTKISAMASVVNETVTGISIVKSYNMEAHEAGRIGGEVDKLRRYLFQMVRLNATVGPLTEFVLTLGIAIFVYIGARRVVAADLDYVDLTKLFITLALMLDPLRKLASVNNMIQTSIASAQRVFEFIDLRPDIVESPNAKALAPLRESIRFEDVRFAYPGGEEVLRGVDIEIKKGEMVALVGPSGAGKSTLVKLLPRFYDVSSGTLRIDGTDIREATFESLREQMGMVTQHTILFAESVADNIAYGKPDYPREKIVAAAKAANAHEFIARLPQGYDTIIDESGTNLSGGQRQRLAIARAFIKDPAILILDEATSSLDSESERLIQDALDQFLAGRTALVIAHRLSTIKRADRILVLEDGRVAEEGSHDALLARGGIYKRLHDTQFGTGTAS